MVWLWQNERPYILRSDSVDVHLLQWFFRVPAAKKSWRVSITILFCHSWFNRRINFCRMVALALSRVGNGSVTCSTCVFDARLMSGCKFDLLSYVGISSGWHSLQTVQWQLRWLDRTRSCELKIPSRELTYPPKMAFWRWCSFSQGGIC